MEINTDKDLFLAGLKEGKEYLTEEILEEQKIKIKDRVEILSGDVKGKIGVVKDIEKEEVQVKVDGKIRFVNLEDLKKV